MRAAIVSGAFPPSQEAVATTVKHLVDEAVRRGHRPLVLAPGLGPASYRGVRVVRMRPNDVATLSRELDAFRPDLVHVADPRLVGPGPLRVARRLGLPTVVSSTAQAPNGSATGGAPGAPWAQPVPIAPW